MRTPLRSGGFAVLAVIGVMLLVGASFMLASVNTMAVRVARERASNEVLAQAKAALIAYAVSDENRPGELPCPDVDDDGALTIGVDLVGSNCASLLGRLPWRTLGLPDLRDDSGERLWYALSNDFHANGSVALNSDTAFRPGHASLAVTGDQTADNVVALVLSAGSAVRRFGAAAIQDRSAAASNTAANYLDLLGTEDNADLDAPNPIFVSAPAGETFNDRLLPVYSDDIMNLVERRAGGEVAAVLRQHYDSWEALKSVAGYTGFKGFYPWAAAITPATDPANSLPGTNGVTTGLVPFSASQISWVSGNSTLLLCSGIGTRVLECVGLLLPGLFDISGRVGNIASAPSTAPGPGNVTVTEGGLFLGASTTTWTLVPGANALDFAYSAPVLSVGFVRVRIEAPVPIAMPAWLTDNGWQERLHYAAAPAHSLTGNQDCATQTCITVGNTATPSDDKQAVVVASGRALPLGPAPQPRPATLPVAMSEYFEGENQSFADYVLEKRLRTTSFNDQPIVVRP